ncbi:hypothetical protein JXA34_01590 [Patescibacteria group bacterium]|nr:hypothetical protein [Patescibacteria group bacterium]
MEKKRQKRIEIVKHPQDPEVFALKMGDKYYKNGKWVSATAGPDRMTYNRARNLSLYDLEQ